MQANLGHPAQEQQQMVPQVEIPQSVPDDITSSLNNHSESASSQPRTTLPNFDPNSEHIFPPLSQSASKPTGTKKKKSVTFNPTPGFEYTQGTSRQSYAQAAGSNHADSNLLLERIRELYDNMCDIEHKLSQNITISEFNLVTHNFRCAMK